jgi:NADPH:quinone reductase-like Zn-dependent oxidoreductase
MAVPIPPNLDFVEAAAVPEAFITAHDALLTQGRLAPGERVLVHAAGSGVGTAATQIAHAVGSLVWGTARTADKLERSKALGLDHGIDNSSGGFAEVVASQTMGQGVNVVIDLLGGSALAGNLAALALKGRLVLVGLLAATSGPLDLSLMLRKRITIVGTTLRARPLEEKIAATMRFANEVVPWLERGLVRAVVDSVFAFEDFANAQARVESNLVFGKVVLRL